MKKYFILAAAAAMMLSACSFDRDLVYADGGTTSYEERIPLDISMSNIAVQAETTRGINTAYQSEQLIQTNIMALFIRESGNTGAKTTTKLFEQDNITSTALTNVTYGSTACADFATGSTLYYPDNKATDICLYAYAPTSIGTAPTAIGTFDIDLSSKLDQSTDAGYLANDIIWGSQGTSTNKVSATAFAAAKTAAPAAGVTSGAYIGTTGDPKVLIPMQHVASKIVINLIPSGMDISKLKGTTVKYYVDYTKGDLNLATGEIRTYAAATTNYSKGQAVILTDNLGDGVTAYNSTGAYNAGGTTLVGYSCCAVVLPQKINAGADNNTAGTNQDLIEIYIDANTSYKLKTSAITTLLAGKVYTYNITVTASGFSVSTTVNDWAADTSFGTSGTETGSATLQ